MGESLKQKTVKGTFWSAVDGISNQGITFLVGLVLARILTPEEYGILATIMIFIAIANSIVDSGFSNALIRKLDAKSVDYNTVFYFNLVVSVAMYALLYVAAPWISEFFRQPDADESVSDCLFVKRSRGYWNGIRGMRGVESGGTADFAAVDEYCFSMDIWEMASGVGIFKEKFPGIIFFWFQIDAFQFDRYHL